MAIELLTEGRPIGQLRASSPQAPGLAQTGQLALGLVLLQKGVDRLADQGAMAAATAESQGLQSLPLRLREIDLGALPRPTPAAPPYASSARNA